MNTRNIAIIQWNESLDISCLHKAMLKFSPHVFVFRRNSMKPFQGTDEVHSIEMPAEVDNEAKSKNFVIQYFKNMGFDGFLHVIEDVVELMNDPLNFINDIENMMSVLGINSFLDTVTDRCNYVYEKYNPRLCIDVDNKEYKSLNLSKLIFCSHSNTQWIIFNLAKADENELRFDGRFKIRMFWIIEYLARRRNTHPGTLYFMNLYLTSQYEHGLFRMKEYVSEENFAENLGMEDQLFKTLKVDHSPDNSLDVVLERSFNTIESKIQSLKS